MAALSELVVFKPVVEVFNEHKKSEDNKPLLERDTALNSYFYELENAVLTNLQKSFLHYLQKAVYNRDVNKLAGVLRYALKLFTIDEFEALRVRFGRSLEINDRAWFISTYNSILKHDALAVGRLDIVVKVLERESLRP